MSHHEVHLRVDLDAAADVAESDLDEDTSLLRQELLELDVADVYRPSAGPPPQGAKGVEAALLGTLIVTTGQEAVSAVVRAVVNFVTRKAHRTVKVQLGEDVIELSDPSREDQQRLIEAFLARHV